MYKNILAFNIWYLNTRLALRNKKQFHVSSMLNACNYKKYNGRKKPIGNYSKESFQMSNTLICFKIIDSHVFDILLF